jgi:hypothetical protein
MNTLKEILPVLAILIVISLMTYTDIVIIGEFGRLLSLVPISLVLLIWLIAFARLWRNENVR